MAVVKDVLRSQDTLSGLKTFVQLLHLDPSAPIKTAIVDYDDIVEQSKSIIFTCKSVTTSL